ncbi:MAG: carboxypeptidase-like regulatory domain-containing protein [Fimbriimonadaceae bacterium]|nr:carboxypeptidase-like regulatory domain-containing protein [Fimbriimonadaceae bacterium]
MNRAFTFLSIVASLVILSGCGGETAPRTATISGTVLDRDFNPVRDATVTAGSQSTRTSSTGSFTLASVPARRLEVVATITQGGTNFRGRTWALNFDGERTNNVNIVVKPTNAMGRVIGTVRDAQGFVLENASVFAFDGVGSSQRTFTDSNGNFTLSDLGAGTSYRISASGRSFRSDQTDVTVTAGGTVTRNFILRQPTTVNPPAPTGLSATAWTVNPDTTRSLGQGSTALAWVKNFYRDNRRSGGPRTRNFVSDRSVEVELFWDSNQFPDLYGFPIYRAFGANGSLSSIDFIFEPLASYYYDMGSLQPNTTYSYSVSSATTLYPDFPSAESPLSSRVTASTLGILNLGNVSFGPLTFNWFAGSGATSHVVFLFDRFPGVGVDSIWNTSGSPSAGFSQVYTGPALQSGRTYYYIVLGLANGNSSRTISQIGSFQL